jgi:molybdenum cofactor cytidylyltransferase
LTIEQFSFAGVILAAGKSSRFGGQKVLVNWRGQPLVRHIAVNAIEAGLSPVIVVIGALVEPISQSLAGLDIEFVHNSDYEKGMGTSLRSGFKVLPQTINGAFLFLGDQPCANQSLVKALIDHHGKGDVVIPVHNGQPGHPVLWNNNTFKRVASMNDNETGRSIQQEFSCFFLDWSDPMILRDIDTREDYQRLLEDQLSGESEQ